MDKQQVLAGEIDGKIVDYVEEVFRVHKLEEGSVDSEQTHRIAALNDHVKNLTQEIAELRGQINNTTSDDKYALTKAKLIRLMKDMGYYD
jgi:hypothetical protein|tara:strand:- start:1547 stop:1816 length:270 start_codon:yes stop_codon:yes gene_type:complete